MCSRAHRGHRPSRPTHRNSGFDHSHRRITSTTKTNFHSHLQHGLGAAIDHHLGHGLRFLEEVIHGWKRRLLAARKKCAIIELRRAGGQGAAEPRLRLADWRANKLIRTRKVSWYVAKSKI